MQDSSWKTNFLLFSGACFLSLLLIEVLFRFWASTQKQAAFGRPRVYYIPESSVDNRDRLYSPTKGENVFRIVVVGDSFTFGDKVQFDDSMPKKLENRLNLNNCAPKVEVLNAGVPGYSTVQERQLLKRALKSYTPDLVILQVTLNDPELKPYRFTHRNQTKSGAIQLKNPLFSFWKSLGFVVSRLYNTRARYEHSQYYFDLFENPATWDRFVSAIKGINADVQAAGVKLGVVIFPLFTHTVDVDYPFRAIHQKLEKLFTEIGVLHLDLLERYQGIPADRLQVEPGEDSHPNEIAYRIAADEVYEWLAQNSLIPEESKVKNNVSVRKLIHQYLPAPNKEISSSISCPVGSAPNNPADSAQ